jgi:hypothetical protein
MYHPPILEKNQTELRLSLEIEQIDKLFSGFTLGDFAVIHGSSAVQALLPRICVKAQLPYQLGGLESNVLFVDGANSFRLYAVSQIAQTWELDPKKVLERIFISRAFTAYQLASLILEKLQGAITKFDSKVVIISNLAQRFLDKEIPKKESEEIFNQLTTHLSTFAEENHVVLIVTHRHYSWPKRTIVFKQALCDSANVVMSFRKTKQIPYFSLEKHPLLQLGTTEFLSNYYTLLDFIRG